MVSAKKITNPKTLGQIKNKSFGTTSSDNLLIHGDNKIVLEGLAKKYSNNVKCIYLDPPYNNGDKYNHYHDDKTHEEWISEVTEILVKIKEFLTEDGSLWISIDDSEMHYLKVVADEIFGRKNFLTTIIWQQRTTRENRSIFSRNHEYILVYVINPDLFKKKRNLLPLTNEVLARYKNPDKDKRGLWQSISANVQAGHATANQFYKITSPNGKSHSPPNGRCWVYNEQRMIAEIQQNNIWFGINNNSAPRIKKFLNGATMGLTPETLWLASEVGTNDSAKKHFLSMFPTETVFDTPKPEELIKKIFEISTNKGDLIMDCYVGSGSSISVAHKMQRKYIGIEIDNHSVEIALNRIKKVIKGEQGGVSSAVKWQGGGGVKFNKL
jgi:adenine-specific DNA-methyltransferase